MLIDADMRRPRLHRVFGVARAPGLAEVLSNKARLSEALLRPKGEEFDLLPAGALPDNPTDLLASGAWTELIGELKQDYELVVIDSPVVLAVPDSLLLAADADGLLLVHKPGSLERRGLVQLRDDLRRAGARPLGVVFNQVDRSDRDLYPVYLESPYLRTSGGKRQRRKARLRTRDQDGEVGRPGRRGHETRVLLLGTGNRAQRIAAQIESSQRRPLRVIGFLDDDPSEEDRRKLGQRYLGRLDHLGDVAARECVDRVIFGLPRSYLAQDVIANAIGLCESLGVDFSIPVDLFDTRVARIAHDELGGVRAISFSVQGGTAGAGSSR